MGFRVAFQGVEFLGFEVTREKKVYFFFIVVP